MLSVRNYGTMFISADVLLLFEGSSSIRDILHLGKYGMSFVKTVNLNYVISNLQMPEM